MSTKAAIANSQGSARLKLVIRGAVQGVGFRPFAFRLATELGLKGWVNNSPQGVFIELEGPRAKLEEFLLRLDAEKPSRSFIQSLESSWLDPLGYTDFEIRASETGGAKSTLVLPDIATCPECLKEIFDPGNRRYGYPFTNCTNCGPRFSIIEALPYDRANTSMKSFTMCPECQAEYDDPQNRRFHAQPNACPVCGPQLELWSPQGKPVDVLSTRGGRELFGSAGEALREGKILALKGLGGFHLLADARNDAAVRRLRELKHREEKPFALMFPSLEAVRAICEVSSLEERLLRSPECPIVLLRRHHASHITHHSSPCPSVAPDNPYLGVMLPYTPLHHLLLSSLGFPVVATSGNLSDEPICIDQRDAIARLGGIADLFLVHNRPIVRHVDDSIVRVISGREMLLRRARGYAPLPVPCAVSRHSGILAVGAHLKNSVALSVGSQVFVSQHIGDLETDQAYEAFRRVIADFQQLYQSEPTTVAADAHADYLSTRFARAWEGERPREPHHLHDPGSQGRSPSRQRSPSHLSSSSQTHSVSRRYVSVQHHVAHVLSCMAENDLNPPALGISWDGTGYGLDGTIWGGEFFRVTDAACERVAHLRPFRLPGGGQAIKEPRRTALGLLFAGFGEAAFEMDDLPSIRACSQVELASFKTMLLRELNSPLTSSVGRLFDALASLTGLRQRVRFEGQAAMELEFAVDESDSSKPYPLAVVESLPSSGASALAHPSPTPQHETLATGPSLRAPHPALVLDWFPLLQAVIADLRQKVAPGIIAARFHHGLVEAMVSIAKRIGEQRVVLSGGCFQNSYLTERAIRRLRQEGFRPYWHQRVPPNDGGICLGQIVAALRENV